MVAAAPDRQLAALGISATAEVAVALGRLAEAAEQRRADAQRAAEAIRVVPVPSREGTVTGGAVTITSAQLLGPATGYAWAVQSLSVAGLGAADTAKLYIGPATAETVTDTCFRQSFTATAPSWQPGRTGCVLLPADTLVLSGTGLASTLVTLTGQVIVMELWLLPEFLL